MSRTERCFVSGFLTRKSWEVISGLVTRITLARLQKADLHKKARRPDLKSKRRVWNWLFNYLWVGRRHSELRAWRQWWEFHQSKPSGRSWSTSWTTAVREGILPFVDLNNHVIARDCKRLQEIMKCDMSRSGKNVINGISKIFPLFYLNALGGPPSRERTRSATAPWPR